MTLEVLICTFNERVKNVGQVFLPQRVDVSYLVAYQYDRDELAGLAHEVVEKRSDVRVVCTRGRGLSANRNRALQEARGDLLLIADDDVRYEPLFFDRILLRFAAEQAPDIACYQAECPDGRLLKPYAYHSFDYREQPRGTYFSSVEIVMKRSERLPRFDERFGLGSDFLEGGEEEVFLFEAAQRGLTIRYYPEVIVVTDPATTGSRLLTSKALQRTKGAVLCRMHGPIGAWMRCLKYVATQSSRPFSLNLLWEMTRGIRYVMK